MMIIQSFKNCGQNSLGHLLTNFDWMVTVLKNFGLDNRYDSVLLTNWSVSGQNVCVFNNSYNRYRIIVGRNSFDLHSNLTHRDLTEYGRFLGFWERNAILQNHNHLFCTGHNVHSNHLNLALFLHYRHREGERHLCLPKNIILNILFRYGREQRVLISLILYLLM